MALTGGHTAGTGDHPGDHNLLDAAITDLTARTTALEAATSTSGTSSGSSVVTRVGSVLAGTSNGATGATQTLSVTCPAGVLAGDLLIVVCGDQTASPSITPPSGWTALDTAGITSLTATVYTRTATSVDVAGSTSYTFTFGPGRAAVAIVARRNASVDAHAVGTVTTAATSLPLPSVTTTTASDQLVGFVVACTAAHTPGSTTPPSGWTEDYDWSSNSTTTSNIVVETLSRTAGTVGAQTGSSTVSTASTAICFQIALKPANTVTTPGATPGTGAGDETFVAGAGPILTDSVSGQRYRLVVSGGTVSVQAVATTVPGAPTGVVAVAGDGQATVSFTAPASNGGLPIVSYTVTSSPGSVTKTGTGSPIVVTGLTNGTPYTFSVVATSGAGSSAASTSSAPVTPVTAGTSGAATPGIVALQSVYDSDNTLGTGTGYPTYTGTWQTATNAGDAGVTGTGTDHFINAAGSVTVSFTSGHDASGTPGSFKLYGTKAAWHGIGSLTVDAASSGGTFIDNSVTGSGSGQFTYTGTWEGAAVSATGSPSSTEQYSYTIGDSFTFPFTGVGVDLVGLKEAHGGKIDFKIDGGTATTVDTYNATQVVATLFSVTGLTSGSHTLTGTIRSDRNASSDANVLNVVGARVYSAPGGTTISVDQYQAGARQDGVLLYDSAASGPVLSDGPHTISYAWTGTSNASSSGTTVNFNKFDLINCVARPASSGGGGGGTTTGGGTTSGGGTTTTGSASGNILTRSGNVILDGTVPWRAIGANISGTFIGCALAPVSGLANKTAVMQGFRPDGITRIWCYSGGGMSLADENIAAAVAAGRRICVTLQDANNGQCGGATDDAWVAAITSKYKNLPNIAFWECFNESGDPSAILHTAGIIKANDPNHLIGSGTGAAYGNVSNWTACHNSPNIDICSMHEYDEVAGMSGWANEVLVAAAGLGKPLIVGEYGFTTSLNGNSSILSGNGAPCKSYSACRSMNTAKINAYMSDLRCSAVMRWSWWGASQASSCQTSTGPDDPMWADMYSMVLPTAH